MTRVLVVTDAAWTRNDVHAALTSPKFELVDQADPREAATMAAADDIEAVVVDLQVSAMGGMAVARSVRENTTVEGGQATPVILLLDRAADTFLAGRSGAAGWVVKPFTAQQLRAAVVNALEKSLAENAAGIDPQQSAADVNETGDDASEETVDEGTSDTKTAPEKHE